MAYVEQKTPVSTIAAITMFCVLGLVLIVGAGMWGCPTYNVWQQGLAGQAELKRAEQNRQIKIQEAKAIEESAEHLKAAEIKRAEGVAAANKIIGESLKGNESYLHYLWIHNLAEAEKLGAEVIYVPTEAGLPILEANRFRLKQNTEK
jgi:regulator of protease activity HflC (stomatin/prohibitin superfamily)